MKFKQVARLVCVVSSIAFAEDTRPNIILIMGDDIGFSDIGCFGSEIDTPNIDRLGYGGMRFTQAYNMAKCNPTRSSMLTGTFWSGASAQSLGTLMSDAGYTTLYSGKEHFDKWVPTRCKAMNSFQKSFCHYGGAGPFFKHNAVPFYFNDRKLAFDEIENTTEPYYKPNVITDYALRFLEESQGDANPFFYTSRSKRRTIRYTHSSRTLRNTTGTI